MESPLRGRSGQMPIYLTGSRRQAQQLPPSRSRDCGHVFLDSDTGLCQSSVARCKGNPVILVAPFPASAGENRECWMV
jgi:hypothetical protein